MKALYLTTIFNDPNEFNFPISEQTKPIPSEQEVLIEVHSSGINPSDVGGAMGYFKHAKLPRIPGRDFSGIVIAGDPTLIGKKVWGSGGAAGIDLDRKSVV